MSHGEEDLNPQSHLPELLAGIWTQKTIRAKPKWRRGLPAFFFLPLQEAANRERPAICNEKLPACMQKRGDGSQRTTIRISRTTQENQWSAIITATRLDWRGNFSFFFFFFLQKHAYITVVRLMKGRLSPSQYPETQALDSPSLHVCHQTCVHFYNNSYMDWKEMSYSGILFNKITYICMIVSKCPFGVLSSFYPLISFKVYDLLIRNQDDW